MLLVACGLGAIIDGAVAVAGLFDGFESWVGETGTSDEEPAASISDGAVDMVSGKWNRKVIAYLDLLTQVVVVLLNQQRWVTSKHCVR